MATYKEATDLRLWTAAGPRNWSWWVREEGFPMWVAWHRPIALWTFIRVYGKDEQPA